MSLDLDEELLEMLGWKSPRPNFSKESTGTTRWAHWSKPQASRIAPGDIDGRSKRNWRHKQPSCKRLPVASDSVLRLGAEESHG